MAPKPQKPDIERITNRHIEAWEKFKKERFTADELETELLRQKDPEDVPDSDSIDRDLYRVSMLGLVEWFGEGKYQVKISPEADGTEWNELIEDQIDWVRSEVNDRLEERQEPEPNERKESDGPEIIEHNGKNYLSAFVGPSSDIEGQARYYQAALSPSLHNGVVLRAYQDVADSAEKLADKITNNQRMSETSCVYRFEVNDMMMEEVEEGLEYQVFLDETKLL